MQNSNFIAVIKSIRGIMPGLGVGMVVLVYAVSAYAGGSFLSQLTGNVFLGYSIAIAIQFTRAVIVFFNQMNPGRPIFGFLGEACAIVFGGFSILEMYSLTGSFPPAVFVSVALLMGAGIVIEILLLREVKYATEQELINNPALVQQIRENAINRAQLRNDLAAISDAVASGSTIPGIASPTPSAPQNKGMTDEQLKSIIAQVIAGMSPAAPAAPAASGKVKNDVLEALELSLNGNGNGNGKNGNGTHWFIRAGVPNVAKKLATGRIKDEPCLIVQANAGKELTGIVNNYKSANKA